MKHLINNRRCNVDFIVTYLRKVA